MNSENGGQSSNDLARQAAAQIARKKVLAAYTEKAQKSARAASAPEGKLRDEPMRSEEHTSELQSRE